MTAERRIAVVSVGRSDWGHLVPVLRELRAAPEVTLLLIVAGTHLAPEYGATVDAIEAEGWPVAARVETVEPTDTPEAVGVSLARGVNGFARAYARLRPDLALVLGDRYEMLAAAAAALPFPLPVVHLHGGELSEGAIDNQIRHAVTKLAHLHFASAEPHARRISAMGEEAWRIHTVGAPGLDRIRSTELMTREAVEAALHVPAQDRWLLVTFHPVTLDHERTAEHVDELLAALDKVDATAILTYPGPDTHAREIVRRLDDLAARSGRVRLAKSLGDRLYLSVLAHADAMVGNSSSGLIEAPSFGLPVVNIGRRQDGRLRGPNVIDVGHDRDEILRGIEAALTPGFRARLRGLPNPYGDGHAAPRIARVLRDVDLRALVVKRFAE